MLYPFFDYFIVYDFEAMLEQIEDVRTERLTFTNKHTSISFSLFSNIEGYDKEPIFECCNDPKELIDLFVRHLVKMSAKAYEINLKNYSSTC